MVVSEIACLKVFADTTFDEPNEATWRLIRMELTRNDGVEVDIELLRPIDWIESLGLEVGSSFTISLPHTEAVGVATVTAVEGCPMLPDGDGQLVIGRFETRNARQLVRVTLSDGSEITGTPIHPIWSEDRQDWVELGKLQLNETLAGLSGPIFVEGITLFTTNQPVYNLEIFGEHVYRVGVSGVLVHNSGDQCEFVIDATKTGRHSTFNWSCKMELHWKEAWEALEF